VEGFPLFGGGGIHDGIYTPRDIKGGSEEGDDGALTATETHLRIKLHNEAQSSAALAQVTDNGSKVSNSDSSDDESESSEEASDESKPDNKKKPQQRYDPSKDDFRTATDRKQQRL
jgi:hypothetical protein